jgi:hypothetical protein
VSAEYSFLTTWRVNGTIEEISEELRLADRRRQTAPSLRHADLPADFRGQPSLGDGARAGEPGARAQATAGEDRRGAPGDPGAPTADLSPLNSRPPASYTFA